MLFKKSILIFFCNDPADADSIFYEFLRYFVKQVRFVKISDKTYR
jgi:hypothetical protein